MTETDWTSIEEVRAEIQLYGRRHPNPYERWAKNINREVAALRTESEALRTALNQAKYDLSKLRMWDGRTHVWQSYWGRIAYEELDEALK